MLHIDPNDPDVSAKSIQDRAQQFREEFPAPRTVAQEAGGWFQLIRKTVVWMVDGFRQSQANDLAAAVAYYALLAIVPTLLALISIVGLVLRTGEGYRQAVSVVLWLVPAGLTSEGVQTLPQLRERSGALGLASLVGFLWIGSTFFAALGRAMNQVYRVPERSPLHQRIRGFLAIIAFSLLFTVSIIAAILPTAVLGIDEDALPLGLERWPIFTGLYQIVSYVIALLVAIGLFAVIFRIMPNAGQVLEDVLPGALVIALAFVLLTQAFPVYLKVVSGWNVIGGAAGLLTLVLVWFYLLAHLLLFGAYINATWQRRRRRQADQSFPTSPEPPDRGQPGA